MLHVLVGENSSYDEIKREANRQGEIDWIVPKVSNVGDDAILFVPERGFIAMGSVATEPLKTTFGKGPAYRAKVRDIRLFGQPIPLDTVARVAPTWK